jgi:diketogulonate reductase-like aldo/keto reductase
VADAGFPTTRTTRGARDPTGGIRVASDSSRPFNPSRRDALKTGAFASLGLAFGKWPTFDFERWQQLPLITKAIPSSGERIPVVGIGTNRYNLEAEIRPQLRETMRKFLEVGGSVYDTATGYQRGDSEAVLGELSTELGVRDKIFFVTKITAPGNDMERGRQMFNTSFERLKTNRIEGMLVHNLNGTDALIPAMQEWKQAGRIKYLGISTSNAPQYEALMAAMRKYPLDIIQVDYSLGNRNAEPVLQLAQERGIAVMLNVPFGGSNRANQTFGDLANVPLPTWAAEFDATSWAQVFLKYLVSHPAVTVAIPGTRRPEHVVDNNNAARGRLPDAAMRRTIEQWWDARGA